MRINSCVLQWMSVEYRKVAYVSDVIKENVTSNSGALRYVMSWATQHKTIIGCTLVTRLTAIKVFVRVMKQHTSALNLAYNGRSLVWRHNTANTGQEWGNEGRYACFAATLFTALIVLVTALDSAVSIVLSIRRRLFHACSGGESWERKRACGQEKMGGSCAVAAVTGSMQGRGTCWSNELWTSKTLVW